MNKYYYFRDEIILIKCFLDPKLSQRNKIIVTEFINLLRLHNFVDLMQSLNGVVVDTICFVSQNIHKIIQKKKVI